MTLLRHVARLARKAEEAWEVPRDLLLGRYPQFVTGGALPLGQIPVFVFHGVEPEDFERKLRYLKDNGYVTLSAEEYFGVVMQARPAPERAVLLTFDDGRGSLWGTASPLLRRYGMRGVVFLVPAWVDDHAADRPTWDDVRAGQVAPREVLEREDQAAFLSWPEIEKLAAAQVFDFESHTLSHSRIHSAPRVWSFMSPAQRARDVLDVPLVSRDGRDLRPDEIPLGTPLLASEPRTSESLRFFEDPRIRERCVQRVADAGGEAFFESRGWEAELRRLVTREGIRGHHETPEEQERAVRHELAEARRVIGEHTGRPPIHLCYPWHVAGPTARRLAPAVGYRTAFCGKVQGVTITPPGGDPHAIARIGEDYVERLPGRGRLGLRTVLQRKWRRRLNIAAKP